MNVPSYIPCHLGLKRLDPSGRQMTEQFAYLMRKDKEKRQDKQPTATIRQLLEID